MADASRLKKKAAEFEAKRQPDRALAVYEQILSEIAGEEQEADIPLYNRAGDLYMRQGNLERAVTLYEKAVDLYSEGGFFNNAIALCNKILRHAPNRASIYYKLGKISAQKGFNSDAKQNFLEYAGRMQKIGKMDEAFHALKEFADLCPSQDDVRLMLAEQLTRAGRKTEAFEQLQILHEQLDAEGRQDEAAATVDRLKALNPKVEPRRSSGATRRRTNDLVFLDVNSEPDSVASTEPARVDGLELTSLTEEKPVKKDRPLTPLEFAAIPLPPPADEAREREAAARALADLPIIDVDGDGDGDSADDEDWFADEPADIDTVAPPLDLEPTALVDVPVRAEDVAAETTHVTPAADAGTVASAPGLVPTAAAPPPAPAEPALAEPVPAEPVPAEPAPAAGSDDDFLDLGDWLRADAGPKTTRMVAEGIVPPPIDEQADFGEMLQRFKEGVAANIDDDDSAAHYDLGIAFKEMGLTEEAIGEFQKALRGTLKKAPTYEALGTCFVEKKQYEVAITVLTRALGEPGLDDVQLSGVLYLLGVSAEELGRTQEAATYYQRVLAVDIGFRDVTDRLTAVTQGAR
ncbi:MAG: tetratricopeptide repeat protein [Gemmatimonadaceae bacterium]|nr:tetratricopeptide repeat protein [Gemmatimonadaceae bacterium]